MRFGGFGPKACRPVDDLLSTVRGLHRTNVDRSMTSCRPVDRRSSCTIYRLILDKIDAWCSIAFDSCSLIDIG